MGCFCLAALHLAVGLLCVNSVLTSAQARADAESQEEQFDWDSITPSWELRYHDCYELHQCARLILPLDWLDEANNNDTVTIAITRLPAVVDEDDPSFGGTVFAQPGGPGVSGTLYLRIMGSVLRDALDIPGKRHYELLAFDPRGTGQSTPLISCFPGVLRSVRAAETLAYGALDADPSSLAFAVAGARADYRQCEMMHGDFLSYIGTPNVARDMVAMVDRIEEQRRTAFASEAAPDAGSPRLELRSPGTGKDLPRLQYIGISYGTALGNYFASMFPGRVGRMVLDGVLDIHDYTTGRGWLRNLQDTDEIGDRFFQGCYAAGPSHCALCRSTDSSWADIKDRVWLWMDGLDENPLFDVTEYGYRTFVRSADVRGVFLQALYMAVFFSQPFAVQVDEAMRGNSTLLLGRMREILGDSSPLDAQRACSNSADTAQNPIDRGQCLICADGDDVSTLDFSDWKGYLKEQVATSRLAGAIWAIYRVGCAGWKTQPNWLFKGPFETPEPAESAEHPEPGAPAAPLLMLSNRWDPVTPLRNAREMIRFHPRAGLMVHESTGHCVTLNAMGPCAKKVLSDYFAEGVVPSPETTCEPSRGPWDSVEGSFNHAQRLGSFAYPL